ncbi:MAG: hypothetical protein JWQ11_826 [Rhizobacter sp.]|nr:hypothetical protein [Rhizobacter sp.]
MERLSRAKRWLAVGSMLAACLASQAQPQSAAAPAPRIGGFGPMAWGDPIAKLGPADALPLVERPGQPYEPCFRRPNESLEFAGIALSRVTWCFYDGGLSYVSLASDDTRAFAAMSKGFATLHGAPRSAGPGAATWGAGPDSAPDGATATLFETKKAPGALLMMLSNRTKIRKAEAVAAAEAASLAASAASKPRAD